MATETTQLRGPAAKHPGGTTARRRLQPIVIVPDYVLAAVKARAERHLAGLPGPPDVLDVVRHAARLGISLVDRNLLDIAANGMTDEDWKAAEDMPEPTPADLAEVRQRAAALPALATDPDDNERGVYPSEIEGAMP